jgi:hypothetical protein
MQSAIYIIGKENIITLGKYALYLIKTYQDSNWIEDGYFMETPELYQMEDLNKLISKSDFELDEQTVRNAERILKNISNEYKKRGIMDVEIGNIW